MIDAGFGWPSRDQGTLIRQALRTWRDGLINLTRLNGLLNFKPGRSSVIPLMRPSASEILLGLARGNTYRVRSLQPRQTEVPDDDRLIDSGASTDYPVPPPSPGFLDTEKPWDELTRALRTLYRRSNQEYLDRGVWGLYLALGSLVWLDEDRTPFESPLLLVPVQIEDVSPEGADLKAAPEDPVINPALALKLSHLGIELPRVDALEDLTLDVVLAGVRASTQSHSDWRVADTAVISYFSFDKEAMYRDLLENDDRIAAHPAIEALALGGRTALASGFVFDEIADQDVD
ncbi:MAG: DUF4011 domain-containing protein, partial [Nitrososphaerales archaeon]